MSFALVPTHVLKRVAAAAALLCIALTGLSPASAEQAARFVSVIVQGESPSAVENAVQSVGGEVGTVLPIVQGAEAKIPANRQELLRHQRGIYNVTPNAPVEFDAVLDASQHAQQIKSVIRSDELWKEGVTGSGTTVALIDTGVYNHPDLAGRVTCGADLTHEAGTEAECADTFGHGTFMAGLIAGNGASSNGKFRGAAPDANIVSVKAAGYDGSADVTNILAAIQWVVAHKDVYGIDVLSLSLGSDTSMDYRMNPMNFAVERAWHAGIVVVTSSSNRGDAPGTVTSPGDDPYVITVGASNHEGSVNIKDDRVPLFSGRGPTASNGLQKPDVVAPGVSTVSLRSPGSHIDNEFGYTAALPGDYFKGTGTSMSTATVAGVVAQMLQANPNLSPDEVKFRLLETSRAIVDTDPNVAGRGLIDAYEAARTTLQGEANRGVERSSGLGFLGHSRGSLNVWVESPEGSVQLKGDMTALIDEDEISLLDPLGLLDFDVELYTTGEWDATKWNATKWNTEDWAATKWNGAEFEATKWNGTKWNGTKWNGTKWNGTKWNSIDWDATKWNSTDWDATKWNGTKWNSAWYAVAWN